MKPITKQQFPATKGRPSWGDSASGDDHLQISVEEEREILRQFEAKVAAMLNHNSHSVSNPVRVDTGEKQALRM